MELGYNPTFYLVWSKMPLSEEELSKIEKSHQFRPYLIVGVDDNNCYGFSATSNATIANRFLQNDYLEIKRNGGYAISSFVNLYECYKIPKDNITDAYTRLNQHEIVQLMKKLSVSRNFKAFPEFLQEIVTNFSLPIFINDIVTYNGDMYFLHAKNEDGSFIGYKISKIPNKNAFSIDFEGMKWFIKDWQKEQIFSKDVTYTNYIRRAGVELFNTYLMNPAAPTPDETIPTNVHNLWVSSFFKYVEDSTDRKGAVLDKRKNGTVLLLTDDCKRFIDGQKVLFLSQRSIDFKFEGLLSREKSKYLSQQFSKK